MEATITRWSAWAPGLENRPAWRAWASAPYVPGADDAPAAKFLPALLRRRCTPFTRTMLTAAFDCLEGRDAAACNCVFGSRHGSLNESIAMLEKVARGERISPALFAHTVHNAQAALFSIAAGNRRPSSAVCAETETFEASYLESMLQRSREPGEPLLLVVGDVPLAPAFRALIDEPNCAYALALLLEERGDGPRVRFDIAAAGEPGVAKRTPWPTALEFLRWLLSDSPELVTPGRAHGWRWRRC